MNARYIPVIQSLRIARMRVWLNNELKNIGIEREVEKHGRHPPEILSPQRLRFKSVCYCKRYDIFFRLATVPLTGIIVTSFTTRQQHRSTDHSWF